MRVVFLCIATYKGILAFIIYPFRFLAIIDLLSILPSLTNLNKDFKIFKTFRLLKTFRVFKIFRYSKNIQIIKTVLISKKDDLLIVGVLSLTYIFISALIVFQVEPGYQEALHDYTKSETE